MSALRYKVYEDNLMLDFAQYCNIQICKHNNKLNKAQNTKQNKSAHTKKKKYLLCWPTALGHGVCSRQ